MERPVLTAVRRRLAYSTVIQGAARAVQLVSLAAGSALIARHDSASTLGVFGLAVLILSLVQTVGDWGLTAIGAQALVNADEGVSSGVLVRLRAQIQILLVAAAAVAGVAVAVSGDNEVAIGIAAGAVAGVLTNLAGSMTAPFQTELRLDIPAWIDVVTRLIGLGALVAVVEADGPTWLIVATVPLTALLDLIATAVMARRRGFGLWHRGSREISQTLMRRATPLAILTIFGVLYLRANSLVVLALLGTAKLGAYSLVFRVVDVLVAAPSLVLMVVFPVLVRLHRSDRSAYRVACQRANDSLIGVGTALSLAIVLAARPLIQLLGGTAYLSVVTPLRILAVAGLAGFANALFAQLMIIEGLQTAVLRLSSIALVINIGLSVLLVHWNGLTGASIAAAISETAGAILVISIVSYRAALGIRWENAALVVAGAAVLTGAGLALEHVGVSALLTTAVALMLFLAGWLGSALRPGRQLPTLTT
jgi:O-antigen/teichoic acid export membrane protein